jgi:hypothetical protein
MNDASQSAAAPPAPRASTGIRGRLRGFLSARLDPKAYLDLRLTIGLAVAALGLWVFGVALDNATMVRRDIATDAAIYDLVARTLVRIVLGATQLGATLAMGALLVAGAAVHPPSVAAGGQVQPPLP